MRPLHRCIHRSLAAACVAGTVALSACTPLHADDPPVAAPSSVGSVSPDDDATSHHSFEDVGKWAKVFDDPARDEWQKPQALVQALKLARGARVADLGAGTGYFSGYLSKSVGNEGTVFAVDTEPNLVVHLRERAEHEKTPNVVPILASPDNPRLPAAGVDLVLIVDTYHHIDGRRDYFRRLHHSLTDNGRVAIIDWYKRELPVGPPPSHKLAREQVLEEMGAAGYVLVEEPSVLPYQYFLIFRPR